MLPSTGTTPDRERFSAFYAAYHRRHVGLIRSLYHAFSPEECEDIVSTAYLHLWQHWQEMRDQPDKALSAWMDTTASRRAIDLWRRKQLSYRYELSQSEVYALANAQRRADRGGVFASTADPVALLAEYVVTHDGATDPERWALARERLANVLRRLRTRKGGGERTVATLLLAALGYSYAEIGAMQQRSTIAVKNDILRAREHLGIRTTASEPAQKATVAA